MDRQIDRMRNRWKDARVDARMVQLMLTAEKALHTNRDTVGSGHFEINARMEKNKGIEIYKGRALRTSIWGIY